MKKKVWFKEKPGILGFGDGEHVLKDGIYDIVYIYIYCIILLVGQNPAPVRMVQLTLAHN